MIKFLKIAAVMAIAALATACTSPVETLLERSSAVAVEYSSTGVVAGADFTGAVNVRASRESVRFIAFPNATASADENTDQVVLTGNTGGDDDIRSALFFDDLALGAVVSVDGSQNAAVEISAGSGLGFGAPVRAIGMAACIAAAQGNADVAMLCRQPALPPE